VSFCGELRSALSYVDARCIHECREKATFVRQTEPVRREGAMARNNHFDEPWQQPEPEARLRFRTKAAQRDAGRGNE
jgi:hypothetical protein